MFYGVQNRTFFTGLTGYKSSQGNRVTDNQTLLPTFHEDPNLRPGVLQDNQAPLVLQTAGQTKKPVVWFQTAGFLYSAVSFGSQVQALTC
ncbi:MAG: hypothetical protein ABJM29_06835 [Rhizobiaceae bacterium]